MFLQIVPEKLFVSSGMGWLKQNQEEDKAKKVAGQQWWAISSLGRQLKGKNPDEEEEGGGEKGGGEKELEVILLSNRQPKVDQLAETEVGGFSFQEPMPILPFSSFFLILFSGDIFYSRL